MQAAGPYLNQSILSRYVLQTWQVRYRYGIYDDLRRLELTHQKKPADYGNADPVAQRACLEQLQQTLLALPVRRLRSPSMNFPSAKPTASGAENAAALRRTKKKKKARQ
jgi:hypothetical protein